MLRIFLFLLLRQKCKGKNPDVLYFAATFNQDRQLDYMRDIFCDRNFTTINLRGSNPLRPIANIKQIFIFFCCFAGAFRYYKAFFDKHSFIDFKNHILFLCMYSYSKFLFKKLKPKAILVANDHSALPLGFASAARSLGIKTMYIQHAHITYDLPYLRFDLAILDGECALDIYKDQGSIGNTKIIYRGLEGREREMNTKPLQQNKQLSVGLFVNIFEAQDLYKVLEDLLSNSFVNNVILREHPAFPLDIKQSDLPKNVSLAAHETSLWDDALKCDLVVGGNSSFHLSVLKFGVPTVFYNDLDYIKYDDYSFIKHDIVYEVENLKSLDLRHVAKYYDDQQWIKRFQYFDAGYKLGDNVLKNSVRKVIKTIY